MAYVPGFAHDIFLSYARVDDMRHWVRRFHDELEVRLAQRFGRIGAVKIWRDPEIAANQYFDATIQDALEGSAVLLAVTSTGYLRSDYCLQEVAEFQKLAAARHLTAVGDRSRVVNVLLQKIPPEQWPPAYGRTTGLVFHDPAFGALGKPLEPGGEAFHDQLLRLVDDVHDLLEALASRCRSDADVADSPPEAVRAPSLPVAPDTAAFDADASLTIFVADVADTLRPLREQVVDALVARGHRVLTDVPPPYEASAHDQQLRAALESSQVSVHLLDRLAGRPIDRLPALSYPVRQLQQALGRSIDVIAWHAEPTTFGQPSSPFAADLNGSKAAALHQMSGRPESSQADILEAVEVVRRRRGAAMAERTVLLDFHAKDYAQAVGIHEGLQRSGFEVLVGPDADRPRRNIEIYKERLGRASSLVIPVVHVSQAWVTERVHEALRVIAANRCPTRRILVLLDPSREPLEASRTYGPVEVSWIGGTASQDVLADLLAQLRSSRP